MKKLCLILLVLLLLLAFAGCNGDTETTVATTEEPIGDCVYTPEEVDVHMPPEDIGAHISAEANLSDDKDLIIVGMHTDYDVLQSADERMDRIEGREIVRVEILGGGPQLVDTQGWQDCPDANPWDFIHTVHQVRVVDVFQGDHQVGDIIEIIQVGGRYDNMEVRAPHLVEFTPGDDMVMFLSRVTHAPQYYWLGVPFNTTFYFTPPGERADATRSLSDELEPVMDHWLRHEPFGLTVEHMLELMLKNFGADAVMQLEWIDTAEVELWLASMET